ncbi:coiled-coil domain-containing protein 57 isoform X3 [Denticeps clupeoides]|uniref:coiled-coil domain-containing protein 57 isoform X3 n=1 Tax=Denticeps clupeoides TaxID=299321 RepID=UPI0010A514B1|nr:coiled-coil domain-containing protein 57 isoform X3 [Denticeps clupeoides]
MLDPAELEVQLASKEKEWKELQTLHTKQLEAALQEARSQLASQRDRFLRLRDDFQFNLRVLDERDQELERYDALAARAETEEKARQEEVSDLRIQLRKLQETLAKEVRDREELQKIYQQRVMEHRLQLDKVQRVKDGEIQKLWEENESLKRDLQRRVQETEGELALQKQEMMSDFDSEMRKREHEFNLRMDEMRNIVLSHELKVTLMSKEIEALSKAQSQATEALQASEELCQLSQKEIHRKEWQINNLTAVKDARIQELGDQLNKMEAQHKKDEHVTNHKHAELEGRARDREAALVAMREAHATEMQKMEASRAQIQAQLDKAVTEQRRKDQRHTEELHDRDQMLKEVFFSVSSLKDFTSSLNPHVQAGTVISLKSPKKKSPRIQSFLLQGRERQKYRQELASAVQREQALDQQRVQLELDWQRRCEDAQAEHYLRSEELIQGLTLTRDQMTADLREKDRELQEMSSRLHAVTMERDHCLKRTTGKKSQAPGQSLPSEEIGRLQQENSSLRAVVAEMRKEMESLSRQLPVAPRNTSPSNEPATCPPGTMQYTQALEDELKEWKARCRHLKDQLEEASKSIDPAPAPVPPLPVSPDNAYLQNHIRSLNETIGGLRVEKVANAAAIKKQEVRLAHLESAVAQFTQQCHSKQLESEELRLELANQKRRRDMEEATLKKRLTALELELEEARREAEEFQKGSVLHNLETVALGNQVSALKLDIASRREPIVLQESDAVRQLQQENQHLRQQLILQDPHRAVPGALKAKLMEAARWISRLSQEKQQLIELSNRLRAQLVKAGVEAIPNAPEVPHKLGLDPEPHIPTDELQTQLQSRLSALEQLQYQLTTQELQYAQRDQSRNVAIVVRPISSDSEHGDKANTANPWVQPSGRDVRKHRGSKENNPPEPRQFKVSTYQDRTSIGVVSSEDTDGSLRDIWQMLDRGMSPSVFTPTCSMDKGSSGEIGTFQGEEDTQSGLQGITAPVQEQRTQPKQTYGVKKNRAPRKGVKIRNYNLKD